MAHDLIKYARRMLANEQLCEQEGGPEEGEVLVKQLIAYMYREAPFNDPCTKPLFWLSWWQARMNNSDASQIAKLGIKVFSVSVSEMCDKRTASKMAAWSTVKKNGLAVDYIINMGILEKYWNHMALEEDEDDSDTQEGTVIVCSFDVRRLAIKVLVNLEAPALVARLTPENATKPTAGTSTARSTPAAPQKAKWTVSSASWGKNDGG
ncbi:hypothetical protein B0H10DRAFT_2233088 [Mycena sp. CBHHK59/15]|nr:hypothetical protein B0H10DRAFT_2233088 [Mycena sp. CBHHK59/15]